MIVNGTGGDDTVNVIGSARRRVTVDGLVGAGRRSRTPKPADDTLAINGQAGDDSIDASGLPAGAIGLTLNGGAGDDILIGSQGNDLVNGGTRQRHRAAGRGRRHVRVEPRRRQRHRRGPGRRRHDAVQRRQHHREHRHLGQRRARCASSATSPTSPWTSNGVETVNFNALGGADTITVNDLTGTDVTQVAIDLAGTPVRHGGDGAADTVIVNGTAGDDVISFSGDDRRLTVIRPRGHRSRSPAEATDRLVINGLAGDDVIEATGLGPARSS